MPAEASRHSYCTREMNMTAENPNAGGPALSDALRTLLRTSLAPMAAERAEGHARAVLGFRRPDGGFAGRRGGSDLYYTGFAARALDALGRLDAAGAAGLARWIESCRPETTVDWVSVLAVRRAASLPMPPAGGITARIEAFRASDGGYARRPGGRAGSVYHTYLALICLDMAGGALPRDEEIRAFLRSRIAPGGGFLELAGRGRPQTSVTAAGMQAALMLGMEDERAADGAAGFLRAMRDGPSGGWRASAGAPSADLLSTWTAVFSLAGLGALDEAERAGARRFAFACERACGGFGAGPWDEEGDPEYIFYGLGLLALTGGP